MTAPRTDGAADDSRRRWPARNVTRLLVGVLLAELLAWWWLRTGVWEKTGLGMTFWTAVLAVVAIILILWTAGRTLLRSRFRFSLRALLIAVGVLGVTAGWVGNILVQSRQRRATVARLLAAGAQVTYRNDDAPGLKALIGKEYFEDVIDIYWDSRGAARMELGHLKGLKRLESLCLVGPKVADADLVHLESLAALQDLALINTNVCGKGLDHLKGLASLRHLILHRFGGTKASAIELAHLSSFRQLERLTLIGMPVTDSQLVHLKPLGSLKRLSLDHTGVSDAGLRHLAELQNLEELSLVGTQVTDAGLRHLAELENLKELSVAGTQVTDAGLRHLQGLTSLRKLHLGGSPASEDGVKELQQALPNTLITQSPR